MTSPRRSKSRDTAVETDAEITQRQIRALFDNTFNTQKASIENKLEVFGSQGKPLEGATLSFEWRLIDVADRFCASRDDCLLTENGFIQWTGKITQIQPSTKQLVIEYDVKDCRLLKAEFKKQLFPPPIGNQKFPSMTEIVNVLIVWPKKVMTSSVKNAYFAEVVVEAPKTAVKPPAKATLRLPATSEMHDSDDDEAPPKSKRPKQQQPTKPKKQSDYDGFDVDEQGFDDDEVPPTRQKREREPHPDEEHGKMAVMGHKDAWNDDDDDDSEDNDNIPAQEKMVFVFLNTKTKMKKTLGGVVQQTVNGNQALTTADGKSYALPPPSPWKIISSSIDEHNEDPSGQWDDDAEEDDAILHTLPNILTYYKRHGELALKIQLRDQYHILANSWADKDVERMILFCKDAKGKPSKAGRTILMDIQVTYGQHIGVDPKQLRLKLMKSETGATPLAIALAQMTPRGRGGARGRGGGDRGGRDFRGGGRNIFAAANSGPNAATQCSWCGRRYHTSATCKDKLAVPQKAKNGAIIPIAGCTLS